MLALAVLFFVVLYLLLSTLVVWGAVRLAQRRGIKGWKFGVPAALAMYLIVFWDHIPTLVLHKYYCETEAGFWVYKTPEQWIKENPGVLDGLDRKLEPQQLNMGNTQRYWLTQRFFNDIERVDMSFSVSRTDTKFYDAKTNMLLARSTNFWKGTSGSVIGLGGTLDEIRQALLFDWGNRQCEIYGRSPRDLFDSHIYQFWKHGERK